MLRVEYICFPGCLWCFEDGIEGTSGKIRVLSMEEESEIYIRIADKVEKELEGFTLNFGMCFVKFMDNKTAN